MHEKSKSRVKSACFGFLDTSVIVLRLNGSNLQGRKAMEALPVYSRICLWFFDVLKNEKKRRQRMEREGYSENKVVGNIEKNVFVIFYIFLK